MIRPSLIILTVLSLGFGCINVQAQNGPTITAPRAGEEVGSEVQVRGITGSLPAGAYLWLLARRSSFYPMWWPQQEIRVQPNREDWSSGAHLGEPRDVGWDFDIGLIVVDSVGHDKLMNYWKKAATSGDWRPIEIPEPIDGYPPHVITVKKVRH